MPRRNLHILLITAALSLACYQVVDRNPYARYLADVYGKIDRQYYRELDDRQLFDDAVNGMLKDLDKNSAFFDPRRAKEFAASIDQHYAGVGIELSFDQKTKKLSVGGTLVGSPAYLADILIGDQLVKVNDKAVDDLHLEDERSLDAVTDLIRGSAGSEVRLTLLRRGRKEPFTVTLRRAEIATDSVVGFSRNPDDSWNYWIPGADGLAYIRLTQFGERTYDELRVALESLSDKKLKGLVLDLRFNGGGLLERAVQICNLFLSKGETIVTTRGRDAKIIDEIVSTGPGTYAAIPTVILMNGQSASASEITAACLQDHGRAIVCGERSYGKGTVQRVLDVGPNIGQLKLTIATYWRPSGKNIHKPPNAKDSDQWGVMPDKGFDVPLTDEQWETLFKERRKREAVHRSQPEDAAVEKPSADELAFDPQLKRAVEYLREKTAH